MYKNNPTYKHEGDFDGVSVYTLVKETDYHMMRYIEALNWQTYATCGTSKDKLSAIADELLRMCNEEKPRTIITDVAAIAQVLKYSLQYPVDQHCSLNMGAVLSFIEYEDNGRLVFENPDKIEPLFQQKKIALAMNNPDAYAFFLSWGIANIPEYKSHLSISTASDYLTKRREVIMQMIPSSLKTLMSL